MTDEKAISLTLAYTPDPSLDLASKSCGCTSNGHSALLRWLSQQERGENNIPVDISQADARLLASERHALRMAGSAYLLAGREGGWPRDWWALSATPAGARHVAELNGMADTHLHGDCWGKWDADGRCLRCDAFEALTKISGGARLDALALEQFSNECWASQFICPLHGRARYAMVRTD